MKRYQLNLTAGLIFVLFGASDVYAEKSAKHGQHHTVPEVEHPEDNHPHPTPSPTASPTPSSNSASPANNRVPKKERFAAGLIPCCGAVSTVADGEVKFESDSKKKQNRISAKINIRVPDSNLGVSTVDDALSGGVSFAISRAETPYAICTLRPGEVNEDASDDSVEVEFKVDIEKRGSKIKSKKGRCDINLTRAGIQNGVPAIKAGDTVKASWSLNSNSVDFLNGTFQ